jgi:hypothetical protein
MSARGLQMARDMSALSYKKSLFRVFCEEAFTTEAPSSQRSENFLIKNSLLRVRSLS